MDIVVTFHNSHTVLTVIYYAILEERECRGRRGHAEGMCGNDLNGYLTTFSRKDFILWCYVLHRYRLETYFLYT